jgi:hypothetical protein
MKKFLEKLYPHSCFEVQCDAFFIGVEIEEKDTFFRMRVISLERTYFSGRVTSIRVFDLDYFSPEIGKQLGTIRSANALRTVQNSYS